MLVTLALYWPAMRCDFFMADDPVNLTAVVQIQKGLTWEDIKWAFLNPVANNWQPLTAWSHMLVCQVSGMNLRAVGRQGAAQPGLGLAQPGRAGTDLS